MKERSRRERTKIEMPPTIRFQVVILKSRIDTIRHFMVESGIRTKREYFDHAFMAMEWAIEQTLAGNEVGVIGRDGVFNPLLCVPLRNAGSLIRLENINANKSGSPDAQGKSKKSE